jgi:hypothetical protein
MVRSILVGYEHTKYQTDSGSMKYKVLLLEFSPLEVFLAVNHSHRGLRSIFFGEDVFDWHLHILLIHARVYTNDIGFLTPRGHLLTTRGQGFQSFPSAHLVAHF